MTTTPARKKYWITKAERIGPRPKNFACQSCRWFFRSWDWGHLVIYANPTTNLGMSWIIAVCQKCIPYYLAQGQLEDEVSA